MLDDHERPRPLAGALLAAVIALVLLFVMSYVLADTYTAKTGADSVTLTQEPCMVPSSWFKKWKHARFVYKRDTYNACWSGSGRKIIVLDSAGDISVIPIELFRRDEPL